MSTQNALFVEFCNSKTPYSWNFNAPKRLIRVSAEFADGRAEEPPEIGDEAERVVDGERREIEVAAKLLSGMTDRRQTECGGSLKARSAAEVPRGKSRRSERTSRRRRRETRESPRGCVPARDNRRYACRHVAWRDGDRPVRRPAGRDSRREVKSEK